MSLVSQSTIAPAVLSQGDAAYLALRHDILSCRLLPGVRVSEPELMKSYALGKSSCRIALTRLCHEQLVSAQPRRGYRITPVTVRDVDEVFSLRLDLEPLAARLAVGRVDIERLRVLEAACRLPHPAPLAKQIDVFMDANKAFHLTIAEASGNQRLFRMLSGLMDEMSRLVALGFNVKGTKPEIKNDHNAMIDAFQHGDGKRAELIVRRHIETFRTMTLENVHACLSQAGTSLPVPRNAP